MLTNLLANARTHTPAGTTVIVIKPQTYLNANDNYTLFSANNVGGATNALVLAYNTNLFTLGLGVTANAVTLYVTNAVGNDFWKGAANGNWDTTPANWDKNFAATAFTNLDFVNFGDNDDLNRPITQTNITLTAGAYNVSEMTFSNNVSTYTFTGPGSLTGAGGMALEGQGPGPASAVGPCPPWRPGTTPPGGAGGQHGGATGRPANAGGWL